MVKTIYTQEEKNFIKDIKDWSKDDIIERHIIKSRHFAITGFILFVSLMINFLLIFMFLNYI